MDSFELNRVAEYVIVVSSSCIRIGSWVFLRWVFPPVIATLLAIYIPAFAYNITRISQVTREAGTVDISDCKVPGKFKGDEADEFRDSNGNAEQARQTEITDTTVPEERGPHVLKTLLTGLPSPNGVFWSLVTFAINISLAAMTFDLTYRARIFYPARDLSMARVGYVSDSTAEILVREPDTEKLPLFASYRMSGSEPRDVPWKAGGRIDYLDNSTDFTGVFTLKKLHPDTRYQWSVGNEHSGFFTTAPRPGKVSTRAGSEGVFTFIHSSCLKNHFPYSPFDHPLSNHGLRSLSNVIRGLKAQFMLFLGDFIYIDVPRRHGNSVEDYRREYRQLYASPDWPTATIDLPWIHVYDDHEVANDWDKNTTGVFNAAFDPYQHYHIAVNPPPVRTGESYFSFTQGPATFFMLDTRKYRSPNDATNGSDPMTGASTKTMLGHQQLADLLDWLRRPDPAGVRWKIVVSSIPFTKNWWYGSQDTWRGYLGERQIILEAMWDVGLRGGVGVIILSGDRHEFAATAFPPPPDGRQDTVATVTEFSASPLNMFYLPIRTYTESSTSEKYVSDVCIKYIPDGNSKFGVISISNPVTSDQSLLHYRLFVDGVETWSYTLTTPPDVGGVERSKDAIWG
ncbi:hypothetical protein M433DRAFT_67605 [Acidomyces richmondensis BFW]|nr:MAG: hypothetical protein FE78DRAFT_168501 [Acidomyces sp. 'richmondensis']KYG45284.1 hypothetical protein M433DRAFT_67605 [Acidomyces richmondensis BFW]